MSSVRPPAPRERQAVAAWDLRPGRSPHGRRRWLLPRVLLLADLLAMVVAAQLLIGGGHGDAVLLGALPLTLALFALRGLYGREDGRTDHTTVDELQRLIGAITLAVWSVFSVASLAGTTIEGDRAAVLWLGLVGLVGALRSVARAAARRSPMYTQNTLVIGAGHVGALVAEKILRHGEYGMRLVGFVDESPLRPDGLPAPVLGRLADLTWIVERHGIDRVFVAFSLDDNTTVAAALSEVKDLDVQVDIVPRLFESIGLNPRLDTLEGLPLMSLATLTPSRGALAVKRAFDIVVAGVALVLLSPLMLLIALAVLLEGGGPVIFRADRIGRGGRHIRFSKFRTMRAGADGEFEALLADPQRRRQFDSLSKIVDDPRVTRVGRVLRKTSLDELPQLLDVLAGRLSIVGPRPMTAIEWEVRFGTLPENDPSPELGYWVVQHLRPGITGHWQINGRSKITFEERVRLDMAYLSDWSLAVDLVIIAKTARALLARDTAY